ncbi:2-hydroxyacid dehydrogenase [Desertivirga xinjiangensis]|uniref:2-hydroxyacid dehydrogenase n=1 Tax=Desertivirga xinjiangensis TaxID=539206 RepID=UPI00210AB9EA|nr:D-glycerate dehydrogenase [Pedobacter xinjiangensis]
MKVFVTRRITHAGVQLMEKKGIIVTQWLEKRELEEDELIAHCKQHDALVIAGPAKLGTYFLNQCRHLKVIAIHGVGYDHVDIAEATRLNIPVGNTPGVVNNSTADTAFLLMLAVSKKAVYNHKRILNGEWNFFDPAVNLGVELKGKTLGVFGLGGIGTELARMCSAAYDMKIIYCNRNINKKAEEDLAAVKVSFDDLLVQSDVISVHSILSDETREVFNREAFLKMKPSSIFINTARGGIHNEADLIEALGKRTIWGAGLDVTNPEPMRPDNPLLNMEYATILPHIGTSTEETRLKMVTRIAENVIAAMEGTPIPYPVNPEIYSR